MAMFVATTAFLLIGSLLKDSYDEHIKKSGSYIFLFGVIGAFIPYSDLIFDQKEYQHIWIALRHILLVVGIAISIMWIYSQFTRWRPGRTKSFWLGHGQYAAASAHQLQRVSRMENGVSFTIPRVRRDANKEFADAIPNYTHLSITRLDGFEDAGYRVRSWCEICHPLLLKDDESLLVKVDITTFEQSADHSQKNSEDVLLDVLALTLIARKGGHSKAYCEENNIAFQKFALPEKGQIFSARQRHSEYVEYMAFFKGDQESIVCLTLGSSRCKTDVHLNHFKEFAVGLFNSIDIEPFNTGSKQKFQDLTFDDIQIPDIPKKDIIDRQDFRETLSKNAKDPLKWWLFENTSAGAQWLNRQYDAMVKKYELDERIAKQHRKEKIKEKLYAKL